MKETMIRTLKLGPLSGNKEITLKYHWTESGKNISVQGGDTGMVFSEKGNYTTAFFEAFPDKPRCFIRGEGITIEEAEESAWKKYQKILTCDHEMERRNRTDGYGYCKHCSYSSTVFEPLTHCRRCGEKTAYSKDYKGRFYCKKHSYTKPKNPNPEPWESMVSCNTERRIPRKLKKHYKTAFRIALYLEKHIRNAKPKLRKGSYTMRFSGFMISPFSCTRLKKYTKIRVSQRWALLQLRKRP